MLLCSCEAEKSLTAKSNFLKDSQTQISFDQFRRETQLNDFQSSIKVRISTPKFTARNADGSYELADFDIDTDVIKRLELDDKITYSFRILPKIVLSPNDFYNLTIYNEGGTWVQNIVELAPTLANFDDLISGASTVIDGKMSIVYTSDPSKLTTPTNCYSVGIIGNNCENPEIINNACTDKKYTTFCFGSEGVTLGQESDIFENINSIEPDYSFLLNTNDLKKNLDIFAEKHVLINYEIVELLDSEVNANLDNFPVDEITESQDVAMFEQALANSGIVNYKRLTELIIEQNKNAKDFVINNKDFAILKNETKQLLIADAIDNALVEHPMPEITPLDSDNAAMRSCIQQYNIDKARCNQQNNINGAEVLVLCATTWWSGPFACGAGAMFFLYKNKVCQQNAKQDYDDCRNNH